MDMNVLVTCGPASACYLGFVKNRTIPIIVNFCSKLVLTVNFLVDCSLSFYAHSNICLTHIIFCVLGEIHWLINPWA